MAASAMSESGQARSRDARFRDRRVDERYEVNTPGGCLNYKGSSFPCTIVDVSLSGCCVRTENFFHPGNLAHVEVVLPILGMVLRMVGTTQWLTRQNLIGIRFFHASSRSKNQLAGLLTCLVDESAAEDVKAAVVDAARSGTTALDMEIPEVWLHRSRSASTPQTVEETPEPSSAPPPPPADRAVNKGLNVVLDREEDAWPAVLRLLKDGSHLNGAIAGLSLEGCCINTAEPFTAGIHARVEVDFQMRGLPFLLAGVTEDVRNKCTVDIRFLELSFRKRNELTEVIEELRDSSKAS
jgi:hypothetical protein